MSGRNGTRCTPTHTRTRNHATTLTRSLTTHSIYCSGHHTSHLAPQASSTLSHALFSPTTCRSSRSARTTLTKLTVRHSNSSNAAYARSRISRGAHHQFEVNSPTNRTRGHELSVFRTDTLACFPAHSLCPSRSLPLGMGTASCSFVFLGCFFWEHATPSPCGGIFFVSVEKMG